MSNEQVTVSTEPQAMAQGCRKGLSSGLRAPRDSASRDVCVCATTDLEMGDLQNPFPSQFIPIYVPVPTMVVKKAKGRHYIR